MKSPLNEFDPLKIEPPHRLESVRLLLRRFQLSDAEELSSMVEQNRERVQDDFPNRSQVIHNAQNAESFIWHLRQLWERREEFHFGVWEKNERAFVGEIFLSEIQWKIPRANIGYYVAGEWEGKGIMTEALKLILPFAFETLEMCKLQIRCAVDNLGSQRVAEKCGFKIEGVLRNDSVKANGSTLVNLVYYGMTPTDYRALQLKPPMVGGFN